MARAQATDYFHGMKFHMQVLTGGINGASTIGAQGGFTTCSMPEVTVETAEYKEGRMLYKRKQAGNPSFSNVTAARGVTKKNTEFYDWARAGFLGQQYKADLQIRHFHRDEVTNLTDYTTVQPKRVVNIYEAQAERVKLGADLDANGNDISMEEIDIAYEYFELVSG